MFRARADPKSRPARRPTHSLVCKRRGVTQSLSRAAMAALAMSIGAESFVWDFVWDYCL